MKREILNKNVEMMKKVKKKIWRLMIIIIRYFLFFFWLSFYFETFWNSNFKS